MYVTTIFTYFLYEIQNLHTHYMHTYVHTHTHTHTHTHRKRLTAAKCLQHAWIKARTNLNISTSSLDSAVCIDSASSMEPSPASSTSSSFEPAPSITTSTSAKITTTSQSTVSKPEEDKKLYQRLTTEISKLATDRHVAEAKHKGEDSPTSTDSSTSTLRGGDSSESIPALKEEGGRSKVTQSSKDKGEPVQESVETKSLSPVSKTRLSSKLEETDGPPSSRGKYTSRLSGDSELKSYSPKYSYDSRKSSSRTSSFDKKTPSLEKEPPSVDTSQYSSRYDSKEKGLQSPSSSIESKYTSRRTAGSSRSDGGSDSSNLESGSRSPSTSFESRHSRTTSPEKEPTRTGRYTSRLDSNNSSSSYKPKSDNFVTPSKTDQKSGYSDSSKDESTSYGYRSSRYTTAGSDSVGNGSLRNGKEDTKTSSESVKAEKDSYTARPSSRATSTEDTSTKKATESTPSTQESDTTPSKSNNESDTDYASGSSRSSSLETTPSSKQTSTEKYLLDKAPLGKTKDRVSDSYTTKSSTLDRPQKSTSSSYESPRERERLSDISKSQTLDRKSAYDSSTNKSTRATTLDRRYNKSSRLADSELTPATVQSLEKYERLMARREHGHHRVKTPEPVSPEPTQTMLLHSPERRSRRKSEGNHPIGHVIGKLPSETLPKVPESETKETSTASTDVITEVKEDAEAKNESDTYSSQLPESKAEVSDVLKSEPRDKETVSVESTQEAADTSSQEKSVIGGKDVEREVVEGSTRLAGDNRKESGNQKEPDGQKELESSIKNDKKEHRVVRDLKNSQRSAVTRTLSQPQKSTTPSNDSQRTKYKNSTDNIYTMLRQSPIESTWGTFRGEKPFRTKTREDDSWRVKTPTSVSPVLSKKRYDNDGSGRPRSQESTPNTSRSNTPTSPPLRKSSEVKRENSFGSRSATPTSPMKGDTDKVQRSLEGRSSPRLINTSVKSSDDVKDRVCSPTNRVGGESPTEQTKSAQNYTPKIEIKGSKSPSPPPVTLTAEMRKTRLSPGRDFRRPKSHDSERVRAMKVEQRKTPVLTPDMLEALDMMIKGEFPDDTDVPLETCVEEEEETTPKKTLPVKSESPVSPPTLPEKKVSENTEPTVVIETPTPTIESRPSLAERRQLSSETKERTKSLSCYEKGLSPERAPEEEAKRDPLPANLNTRFRFDRHNRFRASLPSVSSSLSSSHSMTDLSQIGKKDKARRVSRSNSKRLIGKSAIDSYVNDTRMSPSHRSAGSLSLSSSLSASSSKTLPARVLSGHNIDTKEKKTGRFRLFK